ncbi:MAG TPA: hypothetical protein VFO07_10690 [Roseiflexaceae bacterium]|nr:hypothetical protein [Roseiflexaceae bacterium]
MSKADLVHAVALILLPFVRELIGGLTPLHLIEAPNMGSGKGLLADVLLLPALGDVPPPMAEATTDEEWRKRITSALLAAPTVICIIRIDPRVDIPWQREGFKHPKLRSWVGHDKAPSVTRGLRCWRPSRG